jgi:two-component system NarL family response regulator
MAAGSASPPIRVMLVDDHPVMRVGLANVLSLKHGFAVVAQADDGQAAIQMWREHRPDVCLLDVSMDGMDGIETLRRLCGEFPEARVLMLSSSKAEEDRMLAMQAGARGYVLKTVRHDELAAAIRAVQAGAVLGMPSAAAPRRSTGPLSPREIEVLGLIRQGFSNDEISQLLGISERTVRAHVTAILAALGAADRAQAVAVGFELGILKLRVKS